MKIKIIHLYTIYPIPYTFIFVFYLLPFYLMWGCSDSPTENGDTITVSGSVTLEGRTDYSGVKVSLYKPVELDTALVRINQQYPNIGVQISQETEFDHREQSASYSTSTNASGSWKINDVTPGTYNVVAEKDSFGWQVVYEKQTGTTQFDLYKNVYLASMSNSAYTFESGRCYIINKDVFLLDMTVLNFEANSKIIFTTNNDFQINNSTLTFPNSGWVDITSNEGINNAKMIIEESSFTISGLKVTNLNKGIKFNNCTNGIIKNSYFGNNVLALFLNASTNIQLYNMTFRNNEEGLLTNTGSLEISKNIFFENTKAIDNFSADIQLINNLFLENFDATIFLSSQISSVEHCEFERNKNSSLTIIGNNPTIKYNNFVSDSSCSIYVNAEYIHQSRISSQPIIHNNNFIDPNIAINLLDNPSFAGTAIPNKKEVNAMHNFWGLYDLISIGNIIIDIQDIENLAPVNISDFQYSIIVDSGINIE